MLKLLNKIVNKITNRHNIEEYDETIECYDCSIKRDCYDCSIKRDCYMKLMKMFGEKVDVKGSEEQWTLLSIDKQMSSVTLERTDIVTGNVYFLFASYNDVLDNSDALDEGLDFSCN